MNWAWKTIPGTDGKLVSERQGVWDPREPRSVCKLMWRRYGRAGSGLVTLGTATRDTPNDPYSVRRPDGRGLPEEYRTLREAGMALAQLRGLA